MVVIGSSAILRRVAAVSYGRLTPRLATRNISMINTVGGTPWNTGLVVVPQQSAYVVERFGRFHRILDPGLQILIPFVDNIAYVHTLKEAAITVPSQSAITKDNVSITIDGVLYVRITDAYQASYGIEDPHFAITQLAQTTMRSELGKIPLDKTFSDRESLNTNIVDIINAASEVWGIQCMRYEIRDILPPKAVRTVMDLQAEAERRKRALILDSEGEQASEINLAEGKKQAMILASEAEMQQKINLAQGDAAAILAKAQATAEGLQKLAEAINKKGGTDAMALQVAEQYVQAFANIAKEGNTVLLPANTNDVGSMVAQALTIYKKLAKESGNPQTAAHQPPPQTAETIEEGWDMEQSPPSLSTYPSDLGDSIPPPLTSSPTNKPPTGMP